MKKTHNFFPNKENHKIFCAPKKRFFRGKKAQFYIIAAAIMIAIIASLSARMNYGISVPTAVKFYDLSDNFEKEGYKIIDTYIFQGSPENISAQIDNFTTYFLEYAHEKDPNLGLVYVYGNSTGVYVRNELPGSVGVISGEKAAGTTLEGTASYSISTISVKIGEKETVRDVEQKATAFGAVNKAVFSNSQWVILNLGGSLYSFNTGDNQDFYAVVTTTGGENETWKTETPSTISPCEGTPTKARLGYSCTANQPLCLGIDISSTSTEGNCCSETCKTCIEAIDSQRFGHSECTCGNMRFQVKNKNECEAQTTSTWEFTCAGSGKDDNNGIECCVSCTSKLK